MMSETERLCSGCGHPSHWRACRAAGNGRLVDGCYCRRRGPHGDHDYRIVGHADPLDGEPMYWSNADGWVSQDTADTYSTPDGSLPIGGHWVDVTIPGEPLCLHDGIEDASDCPLR